MRRLQGTNVVRMASLRVYSRGALWALRSVPSAQRPFGMGSGLNWHHVH